MTIPKAIQEANDAGAKNRMVIKSIVSHSDPRPTTILNFLEDDWYLPGLARPHERICDAKVHFSDVPEWLRPEAKLYVAYLYKELRVNAPAVKVTMVALRRLGRILANFCGTAINLRRQHSLEVARHLQSELGSRNAQIMKNEINKFLAFIRHRHPDVMNDFHIVLPKRGVRDSPHEPLGRSRADILETSVSAQIIDACLSDLEAYFDYLKTYNAAENKTRRRSPSHRQRPNEAGSPTLTHKKINHLIGRAIKGQATILLKCVGRRAIAVCNIRVNVLTKKTEWVNEAGQTERGILIRLKGTKFSKTYEDVFCPEALGEIALKAIRTATTLTAELRRNNPQWQDYLFLTPALQSKRAYVLTPEQINDYLNGNRKTENGLLQRYNIPCDRITTHMFRRTRATNAWVGGMPAHDVSRDLDHGNVDVTLRHYIAGGEESRRRFQTLVEHGALGDTLAQLTGGHEIVRTSLGRRHVEVMHSQGMVLHPNRYGYCALQGTGHCIKTSACYEGPTVDSEGCEFHVLSPDALPAFEEDRAALEASIELNADYPGCAALMQSMHNQLVVIDRYIERAQRLQAKVDGCAGTGQCGCKPPAGQVATGGDD